MISDFRGKGEMQAGHCGPAKTLPRMLAPMNAASEPQVGTHLCTALRPGAAGRSVGLLLKKGAWAD
jgi:hypothetical protein